MKKSFWKKLILGQAGKKFSAWQIELTSRCPLRCRMCNKEDYKNFPASDMSLDHFQKLLPYLRDVESVVLEGWGESLLHKNLIECIRLVKKEGPRVGFVTSGKGLNEAYISELIQAQVDFIGFSLAGATPETHNAIRVNSNLQELLRHIQTFQEIKARNRRTHPRFHIVCLLLKENILEAPSLIRLAKDLGIDEVVLINLIHVTNAWQEQQKVFAGKSMEGFARILKEAEAKAREWKINLRRPSLSLGEVAVCAENPLSNLYISTEGEVSPCVYLNPPLPSPYKRIFQGTEFQLEKVQFGNLFRQPLEQVWNEARYVEFRNAWEQRKKRVQDLAASLLTRDNIRRDERDSLPNAPSPCQTCYKRLGV